MNYFELLLQSKKEKEQTLENLDKYLDLIKNFLKTKFENFKILLFGSYVKKQMLPASDIDVLIIIPQCNSAEEKHHLNYEVRKQLSFNPYIEIHIVTEKEYNLWWNKFIKDEYIEV